MKSLLIALLTCSCLAIDFLEAWGGLLNGLQKDSKSPSSCIKSFPQLKDTWEEFLETLKNSEEPFFDGTLVLDQFSSEVVNMLSLCEFENLYQDIVQTFSSSQGYEVIIIRVLSQQNYVQQKAQAIIDNWGRRDDYDIGTSVGNILSVAFNYNL